MYTMFLVKKNCIYIILYYLRYIIKLQIYLYEHGIKYEIKKNKIPYLDTKWTSLFRVHKYGHNDYGERYQI